MPTAPSRNPDFLDCDCNQKTARASSPAPYPADTAANYLAYLADNQSYVEDAQVQDPFASSDYKAFLSSGVPHNSGANTTIPTHDGNTGDTNRAEAHFAQSTGKQQQCRPRAVPYSLAVRFANRSNGAPLATIIEQGSVSTLNSHGSLLSVGRFPSIQAAENLSPRRTTHNVSRSLDEQALANIQEEVRQDHDSHPTSNVAYMNLEKRCGGSNALHKLAAQNLCIPQDYQELEAPQRPSTEHVLENKTLKCFLRDVFHNVRGGSRTRLCSVSMTNAAPHHSQDGRPDAGAINSQALRDSESLENRQVDIQTSPVPEHDVDSASNFFSSPLVATESQASNRKSLATNSEPLTRTFPPMQRIPPSPAANSNSELYLSPPFLSLSDPWCPRNERDMTPARSVHLESRDGIQEYHHAEATTLSPDSKDKLSGLYTFDGVSVYREGPPTLREYDRAQDTSRNASFCSTLSSSYSGTVLGIDLDLQQEFSHSSWRPVTPVWFVPKESGSNLRKLQKCGQQQVETDPLPPRSVTSSALSALLPIATVEGIVQPNLATPHLSFFSPSGSLIQAESSSPPLTKTPRSDSHWQGISSETTSYYNNTETSTAGNILSASLGLPPFRPTHAPMTTLPHPYAPLPEHLRHHHNYQHAERSKIMPEPGLSSETFINPYPIVRGCGGVVRTNSLNPHSGIPHSSDIAPRYKHSLTCIFNNEATRSRSNPLSSWLTPQKGKTLKKRLPTKQSESGIGSATGHAMRICFCQPYDGAGPRMASEGCGDVVGNQCHNGANGRRARDTATPNIRIVNNKGEGLNKEERSVIAL